MASAEQIKALIQSHSEGNEVRFYRVALQLAAHHAKLGHDSVARELRELVEAGRQKTASPSRNLIAIARPKGELEGLLTAKFPEQRLNDLILPPHLRDSFTRILKEHVRSHDLSKFGLKPKRKLLFYGPPGTGKTITAHALAGELKIPLFIVRFESLITKFMGETSAKLRLIFEAMNEVRGIYFFDEFDAIGARRKSRNDVGEVRRILNSFLQFIEEDDSNGLLIAATNHEELLDRALFRRFDDVLRYELPSHEQLQITLKLCLNPFGADNLDWDELANEAAGLSYADTIKSCEDAAKDMILEDRQEISTSVLRETLRLRKRSHKELGG